LWFNVLGGVKDIAIVLDNVNIFSGEIRKALGTLSLKSGLNENE
jgi:hypothetical protein